MKRLVLAACLLVLAGCSANGTAVGGETDTSTYGHVKVGVPF